jgi:hypothetical protein
MPVPAKIRKTTDYHARSKGRCLFPCLLHAKKISGPLAALLIRHRMRMTCPNHSPFCCLQHRRWAELHARVPLLGPSPDHDRSPERRLRVGRRVLRAGAGRPRGDRAGRRRAPGRARRRRGRRPAAGRGGRGARPGAGRRPGGVAGRVRAGPCVQS